jgi:hypothetical protein
MKKPKEHYIDVEGHLEIIETDSNGNRWSKKMTKEEYWNERKSVREYNDKILGIFPNDSEIETQNEAVEKALRSLEAIKAGKLLPRIFFETHFNYEDNTFQKVYTPLEIYQKSGDSNV